jgi:hypothetical protein
MLKFYSHLNWYIPKRTKSARNFFFVKLEVIGKIVVVGALKILKKSLRSLLKME